MGRREGGRVGGRGGRQGREALAPIYGAAVSHVNIGETLRVMGKYEEGEVGRED